jgi:hypothetical protein
MDPNCARHSNPSVKSIRHATLARSVASSSMMATLIDLG